MNLEKAVQDLIYDVEYDGAIASTCTITLVDGFTIKRGATSETEAYYEAKKSVEDLVRYKLHLPKRMQQELYFKGK